MDTKCSPIRKRVTNNDDMYASSFFSILAMPWWIGIALRFDKGPNILTMHDRFSCSIAGKKIHSNRSTSQNGLKHMAVCTAGTFLAPGSDSDGRKSLSDSKSAKNHSRTYEMSFFDIAVVLMDTNHHRVRNELPTGTQNGCVSLWATKWPKKHGHTYKMPFCGIAHSEFGGRESLSDPNKLKPTAVPTMHHLLALYSDANWYDSPSDTKNQLKP